MTKRSLPVLSAHLAIDNAETATFECVYPRCGGPCCKEGRPGVTPKEIAAIDGLLPRLLPKLRPAARREVEKRGFVTQRRKHGKQMLGVAGGECFFFHDGCVLHTLGAEYGDPFQYKPRPCVLFPLDLVSTDEETGVHTYYVRQHGLRGEAWDIFCLNPGETKKRAVDTLRGELAYLENQLAAEAPKKRRRATDR